MSPQLEAPVAKILGQVHHSAAVAEVVAFGILVRLAGLLALVIRQKELFHRFCFGLKAQVEEKSLYAKPQCSDLLCGGKFHAAGDLVHGPALLWNRVRMDGAVRRDLRIPARLEKTRI